MVLNFMCVAYLIIGVQLAAGDVAQMTISMLQFDHCPLKQVDPGAFDGTTIAARLSFAGTKQCYNNK
jgi:hypothetical protein